MKNRLLSALLLIVVLFSFSSTPAHAATSQKDSVTRTADPLSEATVNLYCRMRVGKIIYASSGTGVFVNERGIILTNAHVAQYFLLPGEEKKITGWCSVRGGSPAKDLYTASVLYLSPAWVTENADQLAKGTPKGTGANDFALLYVTGAKKGALPARFPTLPIDIAGAKIKDEVNIQGYPTDGLSFSGVRNKLKSVSASTSVEDIRGFSSQANDVLVLAPSAAGAFGFSGAPVVSEGGKTVGIITSKSSGGGTTARAITLSYIDRSLRTQTGLSLSTLLTGEPSLWLTQTSAGRAPEIVKAIANGLRAKK